jgi:hypothetical protein
MSRAGFQKSVRMFHKFSEETLRRRGGDQAGRESVIALASLDSVLKAEKPFDGSLLEPLSAFTNLLQSSQLPPDFGSYSFGDAILAIEEAHAELRQNDDQRWEFEPEPSPDDVALLTPFLREKVAATSGEHAAKLRRFVLDAAQAAEPGRALVVGAVAAPELPLAELAARFAQLTLNDLDLTALEELVRRTIPEQHRERVKLERYDPTGSYAAFAKSAASAVSAAVNADEAERALSDLLQSYDVSSGSAGLGSSEEKPHLAVSAMLLSELGSGYAACLAAALAKRGFDPDAVERAPLLPALELLRCLVMQHHVQALLRRAGSAVLISAVSQVELRQLPNGKNAAEGEPRDLLWVERLSERLPQITEVKAEQSWEWPEDRPNGDARRSLLTLVEAVLV